MEIQKTPRAQIDNSVLIHQRREVASSISGVEPLHNATQKSQESRGANKPTTTREEIQLALRELEKSTRSHTRSAPSHYNAALPNRTRQALDAYLTHQNHPQEEAQSALRQMLGVDYFV